MHAQTAALYRLLDELRARHPDVEIESCSSGGLRVDLAILERTDRVWGSDVIDPLERQQIQRWTAQLLPPELVGSHVGAPHAHTTGRTHDLSFRAGTALFGSFGIEWDLTTASDAERAELAAWVALYKEVRELLHTGTVVRAAAARPFVRRARRRGARPVRGAVRAGPADHPGDVGARCGAAARASTPPGATACGRSRPATCPPLAGIQPAAVARRGGDAARRGRSSTPALRAPALFPEQLLLLRAQAVG